MWSTHIPDKTRAALPGIPMKVINVAGARPNFMKVAPLLDAMSHTSGIDPMVVHTGQHYDEEMSRLFFDELSIPRPDVNLDVGSASHAVQTARVMERFEPVLTEHEPDLVLVVGDVNSTIACALVAVKLGIPVAHVEAGLRSFDRTMPEEINRILTDQISDLLFVSEPAGVENLLKEGRPKKDIHLVGNVMIDTLLGHRDRASRSGALERLGLASGEFAVLTLHRPSNVDRKENLVPILDALDVIQERIPIVFPVHPRTTASIQALGLEGRVAGMTGLMRVPPLGYLEFLNLMAEAGLVLTDSGGIQEETTILDVPCLTLRENTERPFTLERGTNVLVGGDTGRIVLEATRILDGAARRTDPYELWDGRAALRIVEILERWGS
jgi:UDP-N-acetylglucosamine 2-epimerase (non-hydrolysing)